MVDHCAGFIHVARVLGVFETVVCLLIIVPLGTPGSHCDELAAVRGLWSSRCDALFFRVVRTGRDGLGNVAPQAECGQAIAYLAKSDSQPEISVVVRRSPLQEAPQLRSFARIRAPFVGPFLFFAIQMQIDRILIFLVQFVAGVTLVAAEGHEQAAPVYVHAWVTDDCFAIWARYPDGVIEFSIERR